MKKSLLVAVGLAAVVAWGSSSLAGEKKERKGKGQTVVGTLKEAAVAGDTVTWKITADDGTDKEFPMSTNVVVMYMEKGGKTRVVQIRVAGKKVPEAKGNRQVAQGTVKGVALEGNRATVTVTVDNEDKAFSLPKTVRVMAREKRDGTTQTVGIGPGGRKKKEEGAEADEGKKKRKRKKGGADAPANM